MLWLTQEGIGILPSAQATELLRMQMTLGRTQSFFVFVFFLPKAEVFIPNKLYTVQDPNGSMKALEC